jgi:hypothetical protein
VCGGKQENPDRRKSLTTVTPNKQRHQHEAHKRRRRVPAVVPRCLCRRRIRRCRQHCLQLRHRSSPRCSTGAKSNLDSFRRGSKFCNEQRLCSQWSHISTAQKGSASSSRRGRQAVRRRRFRDDKSHEPSPDGPTGPSLLRRNIRSVSYWVWIFQA